MKKLFALLCVIAILGALCVPAMAASNVPVVAQVPDGWTTAYLYAWNDEGSNAAWPGVPMASQDGWFYGYMPDTMKNVIINNNAGTQTADLAIETGMPVCVMATDMTNATVEYELPIEVPAESDMPKTTVTIHAGVPEAWTSAFVYGWNDSGNNGWPGAAMTKGDDGFWTAEVAPGYTNLIIAEKDGGLQTVDLTSDGNECWIALTAQNDEGKFEATVTADAPADFVAPEITVTPEPAPETPAAPAGDASVQITVYAMVPAEWNNVRLWAWDSGAANPDGQGDWPGNNTMTKGDDGWYSFTVGGQYNNMLINADGVQTGDLSVEAKPEVWLDCTDPNAVAIHYSKPDIEAPKPTEPTEPSATQPSTSTTTGTQTEEPAGDSGLVIGIVVAAIAVIAGAVVIFFVLKKK